MQVRTSVDEIDVRVVGARSIERYEGGVLRRLPPVARSLTPAMVVAFLPHDT